MFCPDCGKKIKDNAMFCPYCGRKISAAAKEAANAGAEKESKSVYAGRDALPAFWEGIWQKTALFSAVNAGMNLQNGRGSARHAAHGTPLSRHPRKQRQRKDLRLYHRCPSL
jgi:uncharacterized Zn finger protein (UPF0148 family)